MKRRGLVLFVCYAIGCCAMIGLTNDNPYFRITKADVVLRYPKTFPVPVYDFRKNPVTPEGFVLGRRLFHDPILSRDSSTSCATCHQRIAAFGHIDHKLSHGINGLIGRRNVPALQNLIWSTSLMWDGGVNHLDVQPVQPITNPTEMDETLANVLNKLRRDSTYRAMFHATFKDTAITSQRMLKAISQFVGMMVSCDSKYDKYMRGAEKFTEQESRGLKIFRSRCSGCHREPLFTDNSFRDIGLRPDTLLKDYGRFAITAQASDSMKFRVPSLRNAEITYPYMHDGRFRTLKDVLNNYAKGQFRSGNTDPLVRALAGLSEPETDDLIVFLKTLTDRTFTYDRRFADPNMQ